MTFSRRLQLHRLLLCCPHMNAVIQKRSIFYKKKGVLREDYMNWLFHEYKFNLQELTAYQNKKYLEGIKEIQTFDLAKVSTLGPDLATAELILRIGGKVKFLDDDVWYRKFEDGTFPIPRNFEEGYYLEGIDASNIILFYEALNYFNHLEEIRFICLSKSKYVNDWYIERILETCPDIEALDLSDCPNITDNGLEILHRFKNLKVVNVTNCYKIKNSEAICSQLDDFCPDLTVIGLNSLPKFKSSEDLHDYETRTSRYLNWGYIMNTRLGLKNDIDFDKFFEAQVEKVLNESESKQSVHEEGDDNKTLKKDKEHAHSSSDD